MSRAQTTAGGFLGSAGYQRSSAWFLKEPGGIRHISDLHSEQAVWNKYACHIVFLAVVHWFNNVLFFLETALSLLAWRRNPREIVCWILY